MHTFTTERLIIRPIEEQDREFYCSLYMDEKIMKNIGPIYSEEQANKAFDANIKALKSSPFKVLTWVIILKSSQQIVGVQALNWQTAKKLNIDKDLSESDNAEIGIILTRLAHGKRIAKEALWGLINYAFNSLNIRNIIGSFSNKNLPSKLLSTFVSSKTWNCNASPDISSSFVFLTNPNKLVGSEEIS